MERPVDSGVEDAAARQSEASAVETLVVVEEEQVFELAYGSSDCSLESYLLPGQEKEPLLEIGLETNGAADRQRARHREWAEAYEVLVDDAEARLSRADLDDLQEVGWVFDCLKLDADLALLVGEFLLHQLGEWCLASAARRGLSYHAQVEERSVWGLAPCFRILHGQVPSSQVLRLL